MGANCPEVVQPSEDAGKGRPLVLCAFSKGPTGILYSELGASPGREGPVQRGEELRDTFAVRGTSSSIDGI